MTYARSISDQLSISVDFDKNIIGISKTQNSHICTPLFITNYIAGYVLGGYSYLTVNLFCLQENKGDSLPTTENTTGDTFVMHAAGPYQISCDGECGGYFVWKDHGLEVNFPPKCSQQLVQVTTNTFLPIKNEVYPGVHFVSAVYQFNCNIERFDKPFTLCLQHCVKLQSPEDCQKMRFIVVEDGSSFVKYGNFEVGKSYGTVTLERFCYIFTVWIRELWRKFCITVLGQDNSSQQALSNQSNNSSNISVVVHSIESQADYTGSPQSVIRQQLGSTEVVSGVVDFNHVTSPPYKYEAMIGLPKDHCNLTEWSGYYSIYYDYGTWRQVCS